MALNPEDERFRALRKALVPMPEPEDNEDDPSFFEPPTEDVQAQADEIAAIPQPQLPEPSDIAAATPATPPPAPYGPGADKAALEAAIQDRSKADLTAKFQDAGTLFNKAFGGHAGDLAAATRASRDDSFNDVMRRRALADQDAAAADRQRKAQLERDLANSGTDVSKNLVNLFYGTTLGQTVRNQLGDRADTISAAELIRAFPFISGENAILKAKAKASGGPGGDDSTALEALAQNVEAEFPGQGDKIRAFGPSKAGLTTARQWAQKLVQHRENELNRTNTVANKFEEKGVATDEKRLQRLKDLSQDIKPEFAQAAQSLKTLKDTIARVKKPDGSIPGTGTGAAVVDQLLNLTGTQNNPLVTSNVRTQDAQDFRNALNFLYDLDRKGLTGVVFGQGEDAEYRTLLANISNGHNVEQSMMRLETLANAALDKIYAGYPDVRRDYIRSNPVLSTQQYNNETPRDSLERSPAMSPVDPGAAKARGLNPAGLPPLKGPAPVLPNRKTVVEPGGANAPTQALNQDEAAAQWVLENPDHPAAPAIKAKLLKKGIKVNHVNRLDL